LRTTRGAEGFGLLLVGGLGLLLLCERGETRGRESANWRLSVALLELSLLLWLIWVAALVDLALFGYIFTHGMKVWRKVLQGRSKRGRRK
jgi:hypothetical protein